ncbi:putative Rab7, partial [Meira miltonrushii]
MSRPLKVLIIGDGDAGKTSLRSRYLTDQFKPAYRATIGADFVSKTIEVSVKVTLSIWDTAGQERFRSLGTAFYRGADAVIIAFDITNKGALARTLSWYRDFCSMGDLSDESDF